MPSAKPTKTHRILLEEAELPLIVRRRRGARHMVLRFQPVTRSVLLTLPYRTSLREGFAFVESRAGWLKAQWREKARRASLIEGATISLQGVPVRLSATGSLRGTVRHEGGILYIPGGPEHFARRTRDWLKAEAERILKPLAHLRAAQLDRPIRRVTVREMSSRWGSCAADGSISFSWRLILAPPEVLDYVVCHEVAHLREMNHGPRFWAEVAKLCPDYNRHRRWLKTHAEELYI